MPFSRLAPPRPLLRPPLPTGRVKADVAPFLIHLSMPKPQRPSGDRRSQPRAKTGKRVVRRRKPLIEVDPEEGREPTIAEQITTEVRRDLPGTAISFGLHALIVLLAAIITLTEDPKPPIGIITLEWASDQPRRQPPPQQPVKLTNPIQLSRPTVSAPKPKPVETLQPEPEPEPQAPTVQPVAVTQSLGGRTQQKPVFVTSRDGFNEDARHAIDRTLKWLVRQQREDGSWSLDGPYADGATRTRWSTDVGATGLALLAFLGDGHTHLTGEYIEVVERGLTWLRNQQRPSGEIYDGAEEGEEPSIYSHAISTIVLCESLALTGDKQLREPAVQGVEYLIAAQNPVKGGWGYRPLAEYGEGDLSVTGWGLMALHTARMAGIDVNPEAFLLASTFIDSCQESPNDPAHYKYRPSFSPDRGQRVSMTASGLLARQWLGWPRRHGPLRAGAAYLLSREAEPDWDNGRRNVYAWYYQAQVLHNLGGDEWRTWFADLQELIVDQQMKAGKEAGSWHPTKPPGSNHEWSAVVGRLYVTVMCALILETPFRHAPLYGDADR